MRTESVTSGALTARAVAGTYGVLLGFDVAPPPDPQFLGFAVRRTDLVTGEERWLPNFLRFEANDHPDGPSGTDRNPLQAFQWGDYTVAPRQRLRYRVVTVFGTPDAPQQRDAVELDVTCEPTDDGHHGVHFNRGIAGSQAYTRKFGQSSPLDVPDARRWMSRGLEEALLAFIGRAKGPGWGLRGAFYEFHHPPVLGALHKAARAGVDVGLVVSSPTSGGWPDYPSGQNIDAIRAFSGKRKPSAPPHYEALSKAVTPRHNAGSIAHSKFLVLMHNGVAQSVWTGSTNISDGALYGHSNVGHVVTDADVAAAFSGYWEQLRTDSKREQTAAYVEQHTPLSAIKDTGTTVLFSPRQGEGALDLYGKLIADARESVFVTVAFTLAKQLSAALAAERDIPRYVLMETADPALMNVLRGDPDNQTAAGAYLGQRGGFRQFMREQLTGLNDHVKYIHTKYLLIDPLTDDPTVVTGSANFSIASTTKNDENMLVIRGDTRVADIYLTEFMRLFTHLRFRAAVTGASSERRAPDPAEPAIGSPLHLAENGTWAADYYVPGKPKARERVLFSGSA